MPIQRYQKTPPAETFDAAGIDVSASECLAARCRIASPSGCTENWLRSRRSRKRVPEKPVYRKLPFSVHQNCPTSKEVSKRAHSTNPIAFVVANVYTGFLLVGPVWRTVLVYRKRTFCVQPNWAVQKTSFFCTPLA